MKLQTWQRVLCCLLAFLILGFAVVKPIKTQALVASLVAGVSYISLHTVISYALSALSLAYLACSASTLFSQIQEVISDSVSVQSIGPAVKSYSYDGQYYLDCDVMDSISSVANSFISSSGDFSSFCEAGLNYDYVHIATITSEGNISKLFYWSNKPNLLYSWKSDSEYPTVVFRINAPCMTYDGMTYHDYSDEDTSLRTYSYENVLSADVVTYAPSELLKTDISDEANLLTSTGIWIVDTTGGNDPENNKKHVVPVIQSSSVNSSNVVETSDEVTIDSDYSTSTSTVDLSGVLGWLYKIWKAITDIPDFLTEFEASLGISTVPPLLQKLVEWTQNLPETFTDHWTDFKTKMLEIPDILREIREFIKNIPETLTQIWNWLKTLPSVIYDSIVNALEFLFIPSDGYLDFRVTDLRTSFPLFDSIIGSAKQLRSFFNFATTPPIIYIDLGASTSWNMGSRTVFIDMSWYAEYKPTMDLIISVFLWLIALWRIFLALPGIITGTSGTWGSGATESTKTSDCTEISIIR